MNVVLRSDPAYARKIGRAIAPANLFNPTIDSRTREIIAAVQSRGDEALLELTERFDGVRLERNQLLVSTAERMSASLAADDSLRDAIALASANIVACARKSLRQEWRIRNRQGGMVGEKFDPLERVGIYVPGGSAPLVSTALMTLLPAKVAGCPEIVVCTPPRKDGSINPSLLLALNQAGATEIYRVGGAQAIAALAMGTPTISRVQKIFGPGNAYVVAAKRLLFGRVGVDLLPGPSELLVLADETANPRSVAADLLAQAEHGSGHERTWLLTPSRRLLAQVEREVRKQLRDLPRCAEITRALQSNGWLIELRNADEAIALTNRIAPEHCEIIGRRAGPIARRVQTAGAIFLGANSPTVLGDYVAGPSHVLPTGGAGLFSGGLTADQFQRRTSVIEYDNKALKKSLSAIQKFGEMEGLSAHSRSAAIRLPQPSSKRRK